MAGSGMRTFSVHVTEAGGDLQGVAPTSAAEDFEGTERPGMGARILAALPFGLKLRSPEAERATAPDDAIEAARLYLDHAFASEDFPLVSAEPVGEAAPEFRPLDVEEIPLTETKTVKFRQEYQQVPVYGSLVTVEMDQANGFVSLNSALGSPTGVDAKPNLTPDQAIERALQGVPAEGHRMPSDVGLYYYLDRPSTTWHLAYIIKDCPTRYDDQTIDYADVVVDAHAGDIVSVLPRMQSASPLVEDAVDDLGTTRQVRFTETANGKVLSDDEFGVETYDFGFGNIMLDRLKLPGQAFASPPVPWDRAAISAHANAALVAQYLRDVLKRDGYDGKGATYRQSVWCTVGPQEWRNAAFYVDQMVYGHRMSGGRLLSYAVAADVVAHEMFHGLTSATSRLAYSGISGALNESYSDIFGAIVSNSDKPDTSTWNWEIGEALDASGIPLRDMSDPTLHGQPDHMDNFVLLEPPTRQNDWGGVHTNSGIHNKAAYNVLTARDSAGAQMFRPEQVAAIFYLALTQYLTRTSLFVDSRHAVLLAARTVFRADTRLSEKIAAIEKAFDAVGIAN